MLIFLIPFTNIYILLIVFIIFFSSFDYVREFFIWEYNRIMEQYIYNRYSSRGILFRIIIVIPPLILYIFSLRFLNYSKNQRKVFNVYSSLLILFILFGLIFPLAIIDRFGLYLLPISAFIYAKFASLFSNKNIDILIYKYLIILFSFAQIFGWFNYSMNKSFWLPYNNLLFILLKI